MAREPIFQNKLSVATTGMTVWGKKNCPENADQKPFPVGIFYGTARGFKKAKNTDGEEILALQGDFAAETYRKVDTDGKDDPNGEHTVYRSDTLYLPAGAQEMLLAPFVSDKNQGPIDFAFEVAMAYATNAQKYTWVGKEAIKREAADPLAGIRAKIEAHRQAALPKPESKSEAEAKHKEKAAP